MMIANDFNIAALQLFLFSPLALLGAGLLLAQMLGLILEAKGLPKLYGAVLAGLLLGVSGLGLVDGPLLSQFQELFNAATALVLFEFGRKMDVEWLWQRKREGATVLAACIARGLATFACLSAFGVANGEAAFMAAILIAASPVIFASMVTESQSSGVVTFAGANMVGASNVLAMLALVPTSAWMRAHSDDSGTTFFMELGKQANGLGMGTLIALLCYGLYAAATRICRARARARPAMLLAALLMDLGLCSVSAASALLSLLLMGLLLRNAEKRDNVFQAQLKTAQEIGYALLFMTSASLVPIGELLHWPTLPLAILIFAVRIGVTRLALFPSRAWSGKKKNALAVSLCSLVSFGSLMVDNSLGAYPGLSAQASNILAALLGINVLLAPALTWWGLKMAGETHEEEQHDQ